MTFQFLCPKGHLLEGEEAHMGMACECPQCGATFLIPVIGETAPTPAPRVPGPPPLSTAARRPPFDSYEKPSALHPPTPPSRGDLTGVSNLGRAAEVDAMLHIPCPNGHELETPPEMIGQRAKCPHCGVEFKLRREKSIEFRHQLEILERRRARFWFQLAIIVACFVVVVLVAMLALMVVS